MTILAATTFLLVLATVALQIAVGALPSIVQFIAPAINYALTEIVVRFGSNMSGGQKETLSMAMSVLTFIGLALTGFVGIPEFSEIAGSPEWMSYLMYILGLFGWIWKGSNGVHDIRDLVRRDSGSSGGPAISSR